MYSVHVHVCTYYVYTFIQCTVYMYVDNICIHNYTYIQCTVYMYMYVDNICVYVYTFIQCTVNYIHVHI